MKQGKWFQSHYGLIFTKIHASLAYIFLIFQSHYGLIFTIIPIIDKEVFKIFQSHYGLIFTKLQKQYQNPPQHFNPTMVWFLRSKPPDITPFDQSFQSHYGLIFTCMFIFQDEKQFSISIPLWSDFYLNMKKYLTPSYLLFQSHYGLIFTVPIFAFVCALVGFQSHYGLIFTFLNKLTRIFV